MHKFNHLKKTKSINSQKVLSYFVGLVVVFFIVVLAHTNKVFGCACGFFLGVPAVYGCGHDPDQGGGVAPDPDNFEDVESDSKERYLAAFCWDPELGSENAPITLYWKTYKNVHLQIYDSKGEWWFNDWVRSNSYTVLSKYNVSEPVGVPLDGRTIYAKISSGENLSEELKLTCSR